MLRIIIALMLVSLLTRSVAGSGELDGHVSQHWLIRTENSHTDLDVTCLLHHHVRRLVKPHTHRICGNSTNFTCPYKCANRGTIAHAYFTRPVRAPRVLPRAHAHHVDCFSNLHVLWPLLSNSRFFQTQQAASRGRS